MPTDHGAATLDWMKPDRVFSALGNDTRLAIFRALIAAGPEGMAAGEVAAAIGRLQQTTSGALEVLERAGLISGARQGRSIRYTANEGTLRKAVAVAISG